MQASRDQARPEDFCQRPLSGPHYIEQSSTLFQDRSSMQSSAVTITVALGKLTHKFLYILCFPGRVMGLICLAGQEIKRVLKLFKPPTHGSVRRKGEEIGGGTLSRVTTN